MTKPSQKLPPSVPTRDDLYHLSFRFLILSVVCMLAWVAVDAINGKFFAESLDSDTIKPVFLIAFVFFLGMSYAFYRQGRNTVFFNPQSVEETVWIDSPESKQKMIDEAFRKLKRPGDQKPPSPADEPQNP